MGLGRQASYFWNSNTWLLEISASGDVSQFALRTTNHIA